MLLHKDFDSALTILTALQQTLEVENKLKNGTVCAFTLTIDGNSAIGFRTADAKRFAWVYEQKNGPWCELLLGKTQHLNNHSGLWRPNVDKCAVMHPKNAERAVHYILSYFFDDEVPDIYFPED
jgi:hypothetical protein